MLDISIKYDIPNASIVWQWVIYYNNSHKELKDYNPKPKVYMAEAKRKTILEERIKIAGYCINHDNDYKGTSEKYYVSVRFIHGSRNAIMMAKKDLLISAVAIMVMKKLMN